ncbi:hypothetical protein GLYMA_20G039550v4 [Glycine max]|nr:hypothetical protein GLYMA_20G039550v4 [Glycine max]KAH1034432.1 hypothetical protein GYH30_054726 [Glycine max]
MDAHSLGIFVCVVVLSCLGHYQPSSSFTSSESLD